MDEGGDDKTGLELNEAKTSLKDARRRASIFLATRADLAVSRTGALVSGRGSVQEKRAADQEEGQRFAEAWL